MRGKTAMRHLTTGIRSEKCVVRRFHRCANVIDNTYTNLHSTALADRSGTVVKVLCYKSEGHWFDPSWCHWNF